MNVADEMVGLPTAEELEATFVNNPILTRIESYLSRFNPIRVMRMERMEIRHSAILAWLLDPAESHGLGDKFLKAFLGEALRGQSGLGAPTAMDIARADMRDAIVRREWQNIDIFIHSVRNGWGFVVENKYDSSQHEGQLSKYLDRVHAGLGVEAEHLIVRGVFLTLHDEEPADPRYAPINYATVCQLLGRFVRHEDQLLAAEVRTFLGHYTEILEEEAGLSDQRAEMERLAKQLYREHKKVLDFIMEHGSGSDFSIAAESLIGADLSHLDAFEVDGQKFRFNHVDQRFLSFLPEPWYQALGQDHFEWKGCEKWWAGYPLIAWLQLWPNADGKSGQLAIYGEVGPLSQHEFRRDLIEGIQQAGEELPKSRIKFQKGAAGEGRKFSKFLKENFHDIKDVQDAEEIAAGMRSLLKRFKPEFEAVGGILPAFKKYGYADE
ncbi:PD-(D/E)XK nuclease family protein [Caulobacter sp. CCH9-E1]|uniref:PDDEXK-like family protein n=1 Tax=Caulobacter sp. CCH9-E1 TaxID=1768768 RepID=UPI0008336809|nr:PD-(D/E)XK nuclease family protein [Caulobacter sp. CCH9-E1]